MNVINYIKRFVFVILTLSLTFTAFTQDPELVKEYNEGFDKKYEPDMAVVEKAKKIIEGIYLKTIPTKKRKVLIYPISWGPHRFSIITAAETLRMIGKETGAYEATISLDLANFEAEELKKYDAVIFPNTTGDVFVRPVSKAAFKAISKEEQKQQQENAKRLAKNLTDYVKGGGGFLGTHGATDCNKKIPGYIDMVGGAFYGHPWGPKQKITVTVEQPEHGLCKNIFPGAEFAFNDEIYEFNKFSKEKCRVLLSLNIAKSDKPSKTPKTDYIPLAWVKKYGEGRMFFSSLGHASTTWANEQFLKFLLPAIQYATGDYKVDDSF
ncbi:MAG: ThuA domain-containing protein [Lentisphaeraceae bacterium]|nr:ThuA domain-containing protein [Lentisphaeraceae bacterium]